MISNSNEENAADYSKDLKKLENEIKKVIIGQEEVIDSVIISLAAGGHVLLEGVPGIAKTLLIKTLSESIGSSFARIQFTPDLLPADITGTKIYQQKTGGFETIKGPVFSNIVLADEINRAPPKVQSALLEAMQEKQVTIQGETYRLDTPFFVLATQNPIESEGTYPLPEAQTDRFMLKILMDYPCVEDEMKIIRRFTGTAPPVPEQIISKERILEIQQFVRSIYTDETVDRYVAEIVDATRHPEKYGLDLKDYIQNGASPRASINLILCSKAAALTDGRVHSTPDDVRKVAHDVLRHRILLNYEAHADRITPDNIIDSILSKVTVP
ncbi:MoxR family ATPase [Methanoplanus sp. FWC-SCC4]|uniref:MoxR family ATPase n=1 Tax=Methanochimaera problematica TaxID=2609417 RepID=A0AA97I2Y3_9EURY|nr:MoxR family ATPase [Methanoplanus sp. FWC-SCC4]WOF15311.1 MoxR family ATPase [Methanoplanus sp. FWC-SCC4]